jgi:hypothetical protein
MYTLRVKPIGSVIFATVFAQSILSINGREGWRPTKNDPKAKRVWTKWSIEFVSFSATARRTTATK